MKNRKKIISALKLFNNRSGNLFPSPMDFVNVSNHTLTIISNHIMLIIEDIEIDGDFVIDRNDLIAILNVMQYKDDYSFKITEKKILFTYSNINISVDRIEDKYFNELVLNIHPKIYPYSYDKIFNPSLEETILENEDIKIINHASKYTSDDSMRPVLMNVGLKDGHAFSSCGHLMYYKPIKSVLKNEYLLDVTTCKLLNLLSEESNIKLYKSEYLLFKGIGFRIYQKIVDGKSPDFKNVIPSKKDLNKSIIISRDYLLSHIKKASYFINQTLIREIVFSFDPNKDTTELRVLENGNECRYSTHLSTFNKGNEKLVFSLNSRLLIKILRSCKGNQPIEFLFSEANKAILIEDNFLQMPVNISYIK